MAMQLQRTLLAPLLPPSRRFRSGVFRKRKFQTFAAASVAAEPATRADKLRLSCPVCFELLSYDEELDLSPVSRRLSGSSFACGCCGKSYKSYSRGIIDLTIPSTSVAPIGTSFFEIPWLAFAYDRGYRDFFWLWNFPGYDEEFRMAQEIMSPARGEVIMDLSCAGGSFTRRFLSSGAYECVVAADYSESMLEQCRGFLETDTTVDTRKAVLLRADAARLPFQSSSLAAIHAGAAIHCWPQPGTAVAEIARVLRPGGIFVASTFFFPQAPVQLEALVSPVRQTIMQLQLPFKAWTEEELRQLVQASGLVDWKCQTSGRYVLFSAVKRHRSN